MHILLDSNILFSALVYEGNENHLVEKIIELDHTIVITDLVLAEIKAVLHKKLSRKGVRNSKRALETLTNSKFVYIKIKNQYRRLIKEAEKLINKKDSPILAAGLQKEVGAIVSGDSAFVKNPKLSFLRKEKIFTTREILDVL